MSQLSHPFQICLLQATFATMNEQARAITAAADWREIIAQGRSEIDELERALLAIELGCVRDRPAAIPPPKPNGQPVLPGLDAQPAARRSKRRSVVCLRRRPESEVE